MSFYRKYRPQTFSNLVGQDHIRDTLTNALQSGHVSHAYLFTGPRGTGKTSTARLVAKSINCLSPKNAEPCEKCDICREITEGRLIDLIEIDAASNRGIDEIRDLKEKINFSPTRAKSKVYIIDEVHMLTKEAFNALLKTLEEPPTHVYFILATTEVHKIPETILSRCQRFDFKRIDNKTMMDRLSFIAKEEKIEAEEQALEAIARVAQGGLRDAIGLLEQLSANGKLTYGRVHDVLGISGKSGLEKLYGTLASSDIQNSLETVATLYREGYDLVQFNKDFLELLREKMIEGIQTNNMKETTRLLHLIDLFQQAYDQARFATIPQLPLEIAVIQSCIPESHLEQTEQPTKSATPQAVPAPAIQPSNSPNSIAAARHFSPLSRTSQNVPQSAPHAPRHFGMKRAHQAIQNNPQPVSFELLSEQWPHVLLAMKNVTAKRTLSTGTLLGIEGNEVRIGFSTRFNAGKMSETTNRLALEEALFTVFQVTLKAFAVATENKTETQDLASKGAVDEKASQLSELLGGELIED